MRAYLTLLSIQIKTALQYRITATAGIFTQLFFGIIKIMTYEAFYRSAASGDTIPLSLEQVISYTWLSQAAFSTLPIYLDNQTKQTIVEGNIGYQLMRPIKLYHLWFTSNLARRISPFILRSIPVLLLTYIMQLLAPPTSFMAALGWLITTMSALILSASIATFITVLFMWTISSDGLHAINVSLTMTLTGMLIPLSLYPDWLQPILALSPFSGVLDLPLRLYIGALSVSSIPWILLHQLSWTAIFWIFGQILLNKGLKQLEIQGG